MEEENAEAFSIENRMGDRYYLHTKPSKTGKPTYYMAGSKGKNVVAALPEGYEVNENINGGVFVGRARPSLIPPDDLVLAKEKLSSFKHLKDYRAAAKDRTITIYSPVALEAIENASIDDFSTLRSLERAFAPLGGHIEAMINELAAKGGMSVQEFRAMERQDAEQKRQKFIDHVRLRMQYSPILRFIRRSTDRYEAQRRYFSGDCEWIDLSDGKLSVLFNKYIRHIGKDSFFELI